MSTDLLLGIAFLVMTIAGVILAAAIAIVLVKKDARKRKSGSGSLGAAALEVHSLLEPERRHAVKSVRAEEEKNDAQGDPP